jgi:hypothetical protein
MVDNINLPKILVTATSSSKIKALEKKHGGTRDGHFKRHLEKEQDEDEKKYEEERTLNNEKRSHINKQRKKKAGSDGRTDHKITGTESESECVKLIDIVV